jgi:hypothetical protein
VKRILLYCYSYYGPAATKKVVGLAWQQGIEHPKIYSILVHEDSSFVSMIQANEIRFLPRLLDVYLHL